MESETHSGCYASYTIKLLCQGHNGRVLWVGLVTSCGKHHDTDTPFVLLVSKIKHYIDRKYHESKLSCSTLFVKQ